MRNQNRFDRRHAGQRAIGDARSAVEVAQLTWNDVDTFTTRNARQGKVDVSRIRVIRAPTMWSKRAEPRFDHVKGNLLPGSNDRLGREQLRRQLAVRRERMVRRENDPDLVTLHSERLELGVAQGKPRKRDVGYVVAHVQ